MGGRELTLRPPGITSVLIRASQDGAWWANAPDGLDDRAGRQWALDCRPGHCCWPRTGAPSLTMRQMGPLFGVSHSAPGGAG